MKRRSIAITKAKNQLPDLVEEAAAGTEIEITVDGRPRARMVPCAVAAKPRRPGALKRRISIRADFDATLPPDIGKRFGTR